MIVVLVLLLVPSFTQARVIANRPADQLFVMATFANVVETMNHHVVAKM